MGAFVMGPSAKLRVLTTFGGLIGLHYLLINNKKMEINFKNFMPKTVKRVNRSCQLYPGISRRNISSCMDRRPYKTYTKDLSLICFFFSFHVHVETHIRTIPKDGNSIKAYCDNGTDPNGTHSAGENHPIKYKGHCG